MKGQKKISLVTLFVILIIAFILTSMVETIKEEFENGTFIEKFNSNQFKIIASSENQDLEPVIRAYAKNKNYDIDITYAGTLDIMNILNSSDNDTSESYDAVWCSNSIWLYMLDDSVKIKDSKCTSINPVIFGITKSKAQELGFIDKTVYTSDIVNAISQGKLKFSMSNPTSTNSGASAYLGLLATLAGNPEVLTEENLKDEKLKEQIKTLFTGLERSSGSEDFLEELFLKGDYEAVVTYESSIINLNKQLIAQNKEPLYAIYPVDGVSISDSPFAYIDQGDESKKEIFNDLQSFILSDVGQKILQEQGRRTWYGGVNKDVNKEVFNPAWGIDTTKYISPVKYPSTSVIKLALNMYQTELRKPVHVVFCLDYSGSMYGSGQAQLVNAMEYILTEKAANDFIQFSDKDIIEVIPFGTNVQAGYITKDGTKTQELLDKIQKLQPSGTTALFPAAAAAINKLKNADFDTYNVSVILMTDGAGNVGTFNDLVEVYKTVNKEIPIYSITFGSASQSQLNQIANLTNAKVFDGKTDLVKAFKEVRGYN